MLGREKVCIGKKSDRTIRTIAGGPPVDRLACEEAGLLGVLRKESLKKLGLKE